MKKLDQMLVVLDPLQRDQPALARAMYLAERTGARLELYCVDFNEALSGDAHFDATVLRELRDSHTKEVLDWLARIGEQTAASGFEVTTEAEYGRPEHQYILHRAAVARPDLIVTSTRFHSAIERTYFTASDWHLIKHSTAPLLFVKSKALSSRASVLAAVDPFHPRDAEHVLDRQILDAGNYLAQSLKVPLHVAHAVAPVPRVDLSGESYYEPDDTEAAIVARQSQGVTDLCRPYEIPDNHIHVRIGRATRVITNIADEIGAGTIVMGAVSRTNPKELFVGNHAEQVLEEVEADVLVLHPGAPSA